MKRQTAFNLWHVMLALPAVLRGRAAEQPVFGRTSAGAADDLARVSDMARSMVTRHGMHGDADSGYTKMHAATLHWFCSTTCLDKFEAEPAKYAAPAVQGGGHGSVHGGHP